MSLIYLQTLFLSLIQGISEFIPVSSSAHLVIFSEFFKNYNNSVLMDASLHLGSLIAITQFPKRLGHPDEFAEEVAHIVNCSYLNGEVIRLDAGIRMPAI